METALSLGKESLYIFSKSFSMDPSVSVLTGFYYSTFCKLRSKLKHRTWQIHKVQKLFSIFFLVEEPSSDFLKLRDYVDALDCRNLSAFSPENLRSGFSDKMVQQARDELKINKVENDVEIQVQGRSQDFSKGCSQTGTPSGDRRLYMVYTAALPRVSAGSVVLSRHEGPY